MGLDGRFKLYFYPRSPCGERPLYNSGNSCTQAISIHALLAESDVGQKRLRQKLAISIHALLAESDNANLRRHRGNDNFYPRSPCGERRPASVTPAPSRRFLSTLSLRRATSLLTLCRFLPCRFLSTLSLRRATYHYDNYNLHCVISIHALLAESDSKSAQNSGALLRI